MQQTLLATKLTVPPLRQKILTRPDLMAVFAQARDYNLTLISAPPGYGKTTLARGWLNESSIPYTWLSLDEGDNDPIRFMAYFLTALHQVVPGIRPDLMERFQGQGETVFQTLISLVINLAAGAGDFFMVLDDFQALHAEPILDMLGYLLEHQPAGMHMVVLSRSDPMLALPRLRARGQLLEVRAEQLRFREGEIQQFYAEVMGLPLSAAETAAIGNRTEGWIAGLQLAGLAMRAEKDPRQFITAFTGSNAYIMDYLTEEVLRGQPEPLRSFLLQTSILDRLCGPLCEAVVRTGMAERIDGQGILEALERNQLFVIPLDGERRWYRYHHLFKEVLNRRLETLSPGIIHSLHRSASEWFEQHGLIHDAVKHAMRAGEMDCTARLVEQHGCNLLMAGELVTLAEWLAALEPYTGTRPWLAMQKAWVLALTGQIERADMAIKAGEELLATLEPADEVRTLRGSMAAARAQWANTQGKTDLAAEYARQAIDLLKSGGDFSCALRSVATSLLGDASWVQGKMEEARQAYAEAVQIGRTAGNPHMTMLSMTSLADVYFEQGQLHQAARLYAETLRMAEEVDGADSSYAQWAHFGLSRVYYDWNRLEAAAAAGEACLRVCRQWETANLQAACLAFGAQIEQARGRLQNAQEKAAAAEDFIQKHTLSPSWLVWVKTNLARFWLGLGKAEKALILIHDAGAGREPQTGTSQEEPVPYRLEPAFLALARTWLGQGKADAALRICERLLPGAQSGQRGRTVMELLLLRAQAHQARREPALALEALKNAIALARPEQAMRGFLDEGEQMAKLLYQAKAHQIGGEFVESLAACAGQGMADERAVSPAAQSILIEPLSDRELEVLRAIAEGCTNLEIAARLFISPKTVKRHISNLYAKLAVKNRTQAVALGRSLKLID